MKNFGTNEKQRALVVFVLILFLLNPFLSLMLAYILAVFSYGNGLTRRNERMIILLGILCTLYLGLVNMTRVPAGDLERYLYSFVSSSDSSLLKFMLNRRALGDGSVKEPAFMVIQWALGHILDGNETAYKFVITIIEYSFLTFGVFLIGKALNLKAYLTLTGVFLMCFVPYVFTFSIHLVRQFMANAILIFVMSRVCFYGKRDYILIALMPMIHTSSIFFVPLLFINKLKQPLMKLKVWFALGLIFIFSFRMIAAYLLASVDVEGTASYVLHTVSGISSDENSSTQMIILMVVSFFSVLFLAIRGKLSKIGECRYFLHVTILFLLFLVSLVGDVLLFRRFGFYVYLFIPIIIMLLFTPIRNAKLLSAITTILFMFYFSWYITNGPWTFELDATPLILPITGYFNLLL